MRLLFEHVNILALDTVVCVLCAVVVVVDFLASPVSFWFVSFSSWKSKLFPFSLLSIFFLFSSLVWLRCLAWLWEKRYCFIADCLCVRFVSSLYVCYLLRVILELFFCVFLTLVLCFLTFLLCMAVILQFSFGWGVCFPVWFCCIAVVGTLAFSLNIYNHFTYLFLLLQKKKTKPSLFLLLFYSISFFLRSPATYHLATQCHNDARLCQLNRR